MLLDRMSMYPAFGDDYYNRHSNVIINVSDKHSKDVDIFVPETPSKDVDIDIDSNAEGGRVPYGGEPGQVLTKTESYYAWENIQAAKSVNGISFDIDNNINLPAVKKIRYVEEDQELVISEY